MKNYFFIAILLVTFSCEDVIDIDLNEAPPILVIDASINWFKDTTGSDQNIILTLTAPYFSDSVPPATGAQVYIIDSNNNTFNFTEVGNTGVYNNTNFNPVIENTYTLYISYEDDMYTATETLKSVVPIDYVEQNDTGGFSGEETELKAFYTDPAEEENHYLFEFISDISEFPSLEVYEDRFTNGNQIFGFYTDEDLSSDDVVIIRNYGISKQFYEYMFILLQQNSQDGGGPFETQPATVRGNCVNQTNPDKFPLGYFRLSEVAELIYNVE